jgi:predicted metal-dependent enzyme (double-stranded beta helix superfamily)
MLQALRAAANEALRISAEYIRNQVMSNCGLTAEQTMSLTDSTRDIVEAANWDPSLDAVAAAPGNHQVLYEDDVIRVLSVTVEPGEKEPAHHHRWPSVFIIDRLVKLRYFDADGREAPLPFPDKFESPLTLRLPPKPLHSVHNEDKAPCHGIRIEFKQGFPRNDSIK